MVFIDNFISKGIFQGALPFYPGRKRIEDIVDVQELLSDGHLTTKYPKDGFLGFHSLKFCSSNAKQMAKYLELSMGFEKVAYKGLETNSRKIASHVVKNGSVVFEIINTLETVNETLGDVSISEKADISNIDYSSSENLVVKNFIKNVHALVDEVISDGLSKFEKYEFSKGLKKNLERFIMSSNTFGEGLTGVSSIVSKMSSLSTEAVSDTLYSFSVQEFVKKHGEGVMDVSFLVTDVSHTFERAIKNGALTILAPKVIKDENGSVKLATVKVPSTDIHHTLIENIDYDGPFLPGYTGSFGDIDKDYVEQLRKLPGVHLDCIDHCVENYTWNQMMLHATFYAKVFGFHKYWSVDEEDVYTGQTALRSIVMASSNGKIKMPINEPAEGKMKGQIEEFYDFNGGAGVQHVALKTSDILGTVKALKHRGIEFNTTSDRYYTTLEKRLAEDDVRLLEDFEEIRKLNILVDYDPLSRNSKTRVCNYILQIFTKPLHDRPTLFIEIIQRRHHNGFGKGTFKGLFETIEEQQKLRGTLIPSLHV